MNSCWLEDNKKVLNNDELTNNIFSSFDCLCRFNHCLTRLYCLLTSSCSFFFSYKFVTDRILSMSDGYQNRFEMYQTPSFIFAV